MSTHDESPISTGSRDQIAKAAAVYKEFFTEAELNNWASANKQDIRTLFTDLGGFEALRRNDAAGVARVVNAINQEIELSRLSNDPHLKAGLSYTTNGQFDEKSGIGAEISARVNKALTTGVGAINANRYDDHVATIRPARNAVLPQLSDAEATAQKKAIINEFFTPEEQAHWKEKHHHAMADNIAIDKLKSGNLYDVAIAVNDINRELEPARRAANPAIEPESTFTHRTNDSRSGMTGFNETPAGQAILKRLAVAVDTAPLSHHAQYIPLTPLERQAVTSLGKEATHAGAAEALAAEQQRINALQANRVQELEAQAAQKQAAEVQKNTEGAQKQSEAEQQKAAQREMKETAPLKKDAILEAHFSAEELKTLKYNGADITTLFDEMGGTEYLQKGNTNAVASIVNTMNKYLKKPSIPNFNSQSGSGLEFTNNIAAIISPENIAARTAAKLAHNTSSTHDAPGAYTAAGHHSPVSSGSGKTATSTGDAAHHHGSSPTDHATPSHRGPHAKPSGPTNSANAHAAPTIPSPHNAIHQPGQTAPDTKPIQPTHQTQTKAKPVAHDPDVAVLERPTNKGAATKPPTTTVEQTLAPSAHGPFLDMKQLALDGLRAQHAEQLPDNHPKPKASAAPASRKTDVPLTHVDEKIAHGHQGAFTDVTKQLAKQAEASAVTGGQPAKVSATVQPPAATVPTPAPIQPAPVSPPASTAPSAPTSTTALPVAPAASSAAMLEGAINHTGHSAHGALVGSGNTHPPAPPTPPHDGRFASNAHAGSVGHAATGVGIALGVKGLSEKLGEHGTYQADHIAGGARAALANASVTADITAITADAGGLAASSLKLVNSNSKAIASIGGAAEGFARKSVIVAVAAGTLEAGTAIAAHDGHRAASAIGSTAGGVAIGWAAGEAGAIIGAEVGLEAGALIGSIVPGAGTVVVGAVGTVVGAVIGAGVGMVGAYYGAKGGAEVMDHVAGEALDNALKKEDRAVAAHNAAELKKLSDKGWGKFVGNGDRDITMQELEKTLKSHNIAMEKIAHAKDGSISAAAIAEHLMPIAKTEGTIQHQNAQAHAPLTDLQIETRLKAKIGEIEKNGWGSRLGNGDAHITIDEIRKTLADNHVSLQAFDANNDHAITGKDVSDVLRKLPPIHAAKAETTHKGR